VERDARVRAAEAPARGRAQVPRRVVAAGLRRLRHTPGPTDGHTRCAEMAEAAHERGFEYLAITEHSRRLTVAQGLDVKRLRRQVRTSTR